MPHKCARCQSIYDDGSDELINGCGCGSKVFLYLRSDYAPTKEETIKVLEDNTLEEKDIEWLDSQYRNKIDEGKTLSLDIENVLRSGEGRFHLNLHSLMRGDPVVIKASEGVYYIDLQYGMRPKKK
jgi:hypothetical protein